MSCEGVLKRNHWGAIYISHARGKSGILWITLKDDTSNGTYINCVPVLQEVKGRKSVKDNDLNIKCTICGHSRGKRSACEHERSVIRRNRERAYPPLPELKEYNSSRSSTLELDK